MPKKEIKKLILKDFISLINCSTIIEVCLPKQETSFNILKGHHGTIMLDLNKISWLNSCINKEVEHVDIHNDTFRVTIIL